MTERTKEKLSWKEESRQIIEKVDINLGEYDKSKKFAGMPLHRIFKLI